MQVMLLEQAVLIGVVIGRGVDERLVLQAHKRKDIRLRQLVSTRQPRDELVTKDRQPVVLVAVHLRAEAAVDRALVQPARHLEVAALLHPHGHARIAGAERRQDLWHPQGRNAVIAADRQRAL